MLRTLLLCVAVFAAACSSPTPGDDAGAPTLAGNMTWAQMEKLLRSIDEDARGVPGMLEFSFDEISMVCISDVEFGRMRIVAAILSVDDLTAEQVGHVLEANFHTALDARYATSRGVLYATFIHPLAPLTEAELASAVRQVATLARTFGDTYTSGALAYGGGEAL